MVKEDIKNILVQRGYGERNAEIASYELMEISDELTPLMEQWLKDENSQKDYSVHGHTIKEFVNTGMKYPAALLTIDWLIKDPKVALKSI